MKGEVEEDEEAHTLSHLKHAAEVYRCLLQFAMQQRTREIHSPNTHTHQTMIRGRHRSDDARIMFGELF